jgi:hypothetical protein
MIRFSIGANRKALSNLVPKIRFNIFGMGSYASEKRLVFSIEEKVVTMKPIFMIGTQRSGSNLLRVMLNQLNEIASPHPPHILKRMMPLMEFYGDLTYEENFKMLADDVCKLVEINPIHWENVKFDLDDVISRCHENSLIALYGAVYDICAERWGAKTWCSKSLENIEYVEIIENYFEKPRYIYLYRDGRDVALSFRKAVVGEKHMYNIAKVWARTQTIGLNLMTRIDSSRFFAVSYENLVNHTEQTARRLCEFLGVPFSDQMLEFYRSKEARSAAESSTLWNSLTKPVIKNNTRKFLREVSQEDITIFESVAGHLLDILGYDRVYVKQGEEKIFSKDEIEQYNLENDRLKQALMDATNREDLERRDRQANFLNEIRSRPYGLMESIAC